MKEKLKTIFFLNWLEFIWSHEYNNIHCEILKGMVFLKWGTIILGIATQTRKKKCEKKVYFCFRKCVTGINYSCVSFFFFSQRDIKRLFFFLSWEFFEFQDVFFFTRFGTLLLFCADQSQHGGAASNIISKKGRQFLSSCFYASAVCLQATCPPLASVS